MRLLLIEDNPDTALALTTTLLANGFPAPEHHPSAALASAAAAAPPVPDAILLDLNLPDSSGTALLEDLTRRLPDTPILILTGRSDLSTAIACMKAGARDFLTKPIEPERLITSLRNALELRLALAENLLLSQTLLHPSSPGSLPSAFHAILTRDPAFLRLLHYAAIAAQSPRPILITGESGTGKELLARAIHLASPRAAEPFLAVNTAGLDDHTFSDTLFGHTRGAFTGATTTRDGLIKKAAAGTLLLDEIGDLSPASQLKLLRLLQEAEYLPLGSDTPQPCRARILAATHRDLPALIAAERFRADLFYRLRVHHLHIPSLRERPADIPLLASHFLKKTAAELAIPPASLPKRCLALLQSHPFPGNVRELEALLFDAATRFPGQPIPPEFLSQRLSTITLPSTLRPSESSPQNQDPQPTTSPSSYPGETPAQTPLPPPTQNLSTPPSPLTQPPPTQPTTQAPPTDPATLLASVSPLPTLQQARELLIAEALRRTHGNRSAAARMLGISPQALHQYLLRKR